MESVDVAIPLFYDWWFCHVQSGPAWCRRTPVYLQFGEWVLSTPAILALEDGSIFKGISIGAEGQSVGEVVFNTSMTGYQEILTDPSYANQMVTLTYPHIGSYGTNDEDEESSAVHVKGLIIRDLPLIASKVNHE